MDTHSHKRKAIFARERILIALLKHGPLSTTDIARKTGIRREYAIRKLYVLRRMRLVKDMWVQKKDPFPWSLTYHMWLLTEEGKRIASELEE